MHAGRTIRSRLAVATVAAATAALVAGPTASARVKPPERPKNAVAAKRLTPQALARVAATAEALSLGYDSYSGLEVFVTRVGGRVVGMPYG